MISNKNPSSFIALLELVPTPQEKHVFKKQRCAASSYRGKHSSTSFVAPKKKFFSIPILRIHFHPDYTHSGIEGMEPNASRFRPFLLRPLLFHTTFCCNNNVTHLKYTLYPRLSVNLCQQRLHK